MKILLVAGAGLNIIKKSDWLSLFVKRYSLVKSGWDYGLTGSLLSSRVEKMF